MFLCRWICLFWCEWGSCLVVLVGLWGNLFVCEDIVVVILSKLWGNEKKIVSEGRDGGWVVVSELRKIDEFEKLFDMVLFGFKNERWLGRKEIW